MNAEFSLPRYGHNPNLTEIPNAVSTFPVNNSNVFLAMTIKHQRINERADSPNVLSGSDHSKKKRQRTISDSSECYAFENNRYHSNVNASASNDLSYNVNNTRSIKESTTYSPRMMTLLQSLEALDEKEQRKVNQQLTVNPSTAPPSTPFDLSTSTTQAAAALRQQNQRYPKIPQPLTARPAIHKIEERPITPVSASQAKTDPLSVTTISQFESRDVINATPAVDAPYFDTVKRAVRVAAPSASEDIASSSSLEQRRIAGAVALAAVATTCGNTSAQTPTMATNTIRNQNIPLISFPFPNKPPSATTTTYDAAHLNHSIRPLSIQEPTARQLAIHNAVHSDYKKVYKPLQRPPRLPTPHEALVVAAISTPTPATSICR